MGEDPETSALDRWCRAYEVNNLPTAMGANPTLTFVANALRAADHLS